MNLISRLVAIRPTAKVCLAIVIGLAGPVASLAPSRAAPRGEDPWVEQAFARMSAAERVGQLFVVTFPGNETRAGSEIRQLIVDLHIGGVLISPVNGNFSDDASGPRQLMDLVSRLQALQAEAPFIPPTTTPTARSSDTPTRGPTSSATALETTTPLARPSGTPTATLSASATPTATGSPEATATPTLVAVGKLPFLGDMGVTTARGLVAPLFVALEVDASGVPDGTIAKGLSQFSSAMTLGATWNPQNAEIVGALVGEELQLLGVNLLLGPSLDVNDRPRPGQSGDLGVNTFGGDPYWVGELGRAFVHGVHRGGGGEVLTIAKHLPGQGSADRSILDEVATVQKSLEEMRRIELTPFFATTNVESKDTLGLTDGLMVSHIRYRGFQGNIRQLTRPISLDAQGMQALLGLPEMAKWRAAGGLLVADSLGAPALRKFYDPLLKTFPAKRVAQDAFLAGNDLLLLSRFGLSDTWEEHIANVRSTIEFFVTQYDEDPAFQARVDESVKRILAAKHKLMPGASEEPVSERLVKLEKRVASASADLLQVARQAITQIYPAPEQLGDRAPSPPLEKEEIVVITDATPALRCDGCEPMPRLTKDRFASVLLKLYGPQATGHVTPDRVHSFSSTELAEYLAAPNDRRSGGGIGPLIERADWIVLIMLDADPTRPAALESFRGYLTSASQSAKGSRVVVLACGAPYYLDGTDLSKVTALYAGYSHSQEVLEALARAVFRDLVTTGASPVSIASLNYDVLTRTEPNPGQLLQVKPVDVPAGGDKATLNVGVGDSLRLVTEPVVDRNGRPVPDGTPVTFRLFYPVERLERRQTVVTAGGKAETSVVLERTGVLEITVASGSAEQSTKLVVTISGKQAVLATVIPIPTATATRAPPTVTATLAPTPAPTATPVPPMSRWREPREAGLTLNTLIKLLAGAAGLGLLMWMWMRRAKVPADRMARIEVLGLAAALAWYVLLGVWIAFVRPDLDGAGGSSVASNLSVGGGLVSSAGVQAVLALRGGKVAAAGTGRRR